MIRILAAFAVLASLGACNTVQGVGRDISAGGAVISGVADKARPVRTVSQPYYHY